MVDPELLSILVCPESRQSVRPADGELLARVNRAIDSGTLQNRGGEVVREKLTEGLVREDDRVIYPVREDIPIMLIDEAIMVDSLS